jgi:hypothetical protein
MTLAQDRIAKGQCPNDGKEAAPYRLCYDCRQLRRVIRSLKRGERFGTVKSERKSDGVVYWSLGLNSNDPEARKATNKWQTPWMPRENDLRHRPRLRGISVDVEATLYEVVSHIGRPCTIEEITAAWGKLRDRRTSPLPVDLAALIKAGDKRARRNAKRIKQIEKSLSRC